MRNNIDLFANGESRLNNGKSPRRRATSLWRGLMIGLGLLGCTLLAPSVRANAQTYDVYLYNSYGVLVDESAYYGYQQGHVYDLSTNAVIGTVPNLGTGVIVDSNGDDIGELESAN
jgi:hypothetical protein